MKNGLSRFTFYTVQIDALLSKARQEKNPAMWLFKNNARTPFFMLEGLAKIYGGMHYAKKFGKLKEHFKMIEDGLGQIDYYESLSGILEARKQIPAECIRYIKKQSEQRGAQLNEVLTDRDWLAGDKRRIIKITKKLNEVDWLNPVEEVEGISGFYETSIANISEFADQANYHFVNIEKDVHELRRKLRWLSIYPQALQGVIQYVADNKVPAHLKKYMTEEIISSPYNRLPVPGNNSHLLMLHKNYYLALSWIIDQLGILKDEGLLLKGLSEALKQITECNEDEASEKAFVILGRNQRNTEEILKNAETITKTFFKEKNLQHLVAGKRLHHFDKNVIGPINILMINTVIKDKNSG